MWTGKYEDDGREGLGRRHILQRGGNLLCLSAAGRSFFVMSLPTMCVRVCAHVCVPGGCQNNRKQRTLKRNQRKANSSQSNGHRVSRVNRAASCCFGIFSCVCSPKNLQ